MAVDIVAQRRYVTLYRNFSAVDVGGAAQVTEPEIYRSPLPAPATGPPPVVAALRHAAADPDRPAVVDGATGQRLSRAELADRSAAMAAGLAGRGVGRGDLVAVALPNLGVWPVVAMGVWRAGAAVVPVSTRWTAEETARVLALVRPRMAIASEASLPPLRGALAAAGSDAEVVVHGEAEGVTPLQRLLAAGAGDRFAEPRLAPGDLAVVPFSSGTGGLAKGVRLTHGNLAASSAQVATSLGYGAGSVALSAVPFFHVMGLGLSLCVPLSVGARIVTFPLPDTGRILEAVAEHRVTHATVPLPMFTELADDPRAERLDASRLELLATAGAHVPAAVELRAGERLRCLARQGYGMTEATTMISGPMGLGRPGEPGTVGWLAAGTEARLVDPEDGRDLPPGQPGELWVRGPQVMAGYHDDPDATAATITADGWLRTGDLVTIRDDGQLVVQDRLKELIKVDGAQVPPAELELVLREHPSVRDAAVVGRPDAEAGEVPVAHVVLAGPATPEELAAFVAPRVAAHKRLRGVRLVDDLPRMPSGKLLRRTLRDRERALPGPPAAGRPAAGVTPEGSPPPAAPTRRG
jgi:acyl-CoA synthetase (AMP-forming)/AMP-acid ligase II